MKQKQVDDGHVETLPTPEETSVDERVQETKVEAEVEVEAPEVDAMTPIENEAEHRRRPTAIKTVLMDLAPRKSHCQRRRKRRR